MMAAIAEKIMLVLLDGLARLLFALYWAAPLAWGLGLLAMLGALASDAWASALLPPLLRGTPWRWGLAALTALALVGSRRRAAPDNPNRQYLGPAGWIDARIDSLFAWIGTIKYFKSPLCLVEDSGAYRIKGDQVRQLIDGVLQPGDILLRGFDGYLDGLLISQSGGATGLQQHFSHAALYLGDLDDARDRPIVARRLQTLDAQGRWAPATDAQKDAIRQSASYYQGGRQKVVHAMTRGVFVEDILSFLRCDHLAVLRLRNASIQYDQATLQAAGQTQLIHDLSGQALALHLRLMQGQTVSRQEVLDAVHDSALGKIGSCYDFQFNAIKTAHVFSCSEFVYYCFKSIHCHLGLLPRRHAFLDRFFARDTITPGDIFDASVAQPDRSARLELVWSSAP